MCMLLGDMANERYKTVDTIKMFSVTIHDNDIDNVVLIKLDYVVTVLHVGDDPDIPPAGRPVYADAVRAYWIGRSYALELQCPIKPLSNRVCTRSMTRTIKDAHTCIKNIIYNT